MQGKKPQKIIKKLRGRETTYDRELKNTTPILINPKQSYKKHNDSST